MCPLHTNHIACISFLEALLTAAKIAQYLMCNVVLTKQLVVGNWKPILRTTTKVWLTCHDSSPLKVYSKCASFTSGKTVLLSPLQWKYTVGLPNHSWVVNISTLSSVTSLDERVPTKVRSSVMHKLLVKEILNYICRTLYKYHKWQQKNVCNKNMQLLLPHSQRMDRPVQTNLIQSHY